MSTAKTAIEAAVRTTTNLMDYHRENAVRELRDLAERASKMAEQVADGRVYNSGHNIATVTALAVESLAKFQASNEELTQLKWLAGQIGL